MFERNFTKIHRPLGVRCVRVNVSPPLPCTGELSPYYKSVGKKNVFDSIFCVIACNRIFSIGFSAFLLFGAWLGPVGKLLGRSWRVLGHSWVAFGRSLGALGASWDAFGVLLGTSWGVLGASWKNIEKFSKKPSFLGPMLGPQMGAKINKNRIQKAMRFLTWSFIDFLIFFIDLGVQISMFFGSLKLDAMRETSIL